MRSLLLIFMLLMSVFAKANMAEPMIYGSHNANGYTSEFVDVLHEDLKIKILKGFGKAEIYATYFISADKSGMQIPMVFFADNYLGSFQIKVDGKIIKYLGEDYDSRLVGDVEGFNYFNLKSEDGRHSNVLRWHDESSFSDVDIEDMLYFEMDLDSGEHQIEVFYIAYSSTDKWEKINSYFFSYELSPITHWRSFGGLDFELDIEDLDESWDEIGVDFDNPTISESKGIKKWHFEVIPADLIKITWMPTLSSWSSFFVDLGAFWFAIILMLPILIVQHIFSMKSWKGEKKRKYSNIITLPLLLIVPIIFIILLMYSYGWVDKLVGEHANRMYVSIYTIIYIPLLYPFYLLANFALVGFSHRWFIRKNKLG
ncbi:MAG: hypothetical protein ACI857_002801 [Arenicella sp.]|jgi:hypothetical protein